MQLKLSLIKDENTAKMISATEIRYYYKTMPPRCQVK